MRRRFALPVLVAALFARAPDAGADDDTTVVVTVGKQSMTVSDIERRLARVPPAQLRQLGATPEAIRKAFVEHVVVPDLLYAEEAAARNLIGTNARTGDGVRETLKTALENDVKEELGKKPLTDLEVREYFEQNRSRFETPQRIQIWRILTATEKDALAIIVDAKTQSGTTRWSQMARDKSVDEATRLRDGNLGFVRADGQTNVPTVRVDPALFAAAEKVKDGEIVPEPVREGERWAVVWRRGSVAPVARAFAQEETNIRDVLTRKRIAGELNGVLERLQKTEVKQKNAHLVKYVAITSDGDLRARERPGIAPRRAAGPPQPKPGEQGLR